jgi:PKHD-type hydroxylase
MLVRLTKLLDTATVVRARELLARATWKDGRASARGRAKEVKHNLVVPQDDPASQECNQLLLQRLSVDEGFRAAVLPRTIMPLKFCRYDEGMAYGDHLDLPLMGTATGAIRTDLSMSVFLSDPSDYDGGALVFDSDYGRREVRGEAGEAVIYPSSTTHRVTPVTRGSRLVAITWIQSMVRDSAQRRILYDLAQVATELESSTMDPSLGDTLRRTQYNLLRLWAE